MQNILAAIKVGGLAINTAEVVRSQFFSAGWDAEVVKNR